MKLVAALGPKIPSIQREDVGFSEKAPDVVHLLRRQGLKNLPFHEVAQVHAGDTHEGSGFPIQEDPIIGSGESTGDMQQNLHLFTAGNGNRIREAAVVGS
jgi:hypothetical protein